MSTVENVRKAIERVRSLSPAGSRDAATELADAIEAWAAESDPLARAVIDRQHAGASTLLADSVTRLYEATSKR